MKIYRLLFALLFIFVFTSQTFATSYTWNGGTSSDWGTSTNWTPNGVPGASDDVVIVSAGSSPVYDGVAGATNFTITSGTLDLNGYTISITGTAAFNSGIINNGTVDCSGSSSTFAGTTFGAKVTVVSASILLNGSRFESTTYFEKTGSSGNNSTGSNVFLDTCTIINNGTQYIATKNDTFFKPVYLYNLGSSFVSPAFGGLYTCFKDDIYVKSKAGQGVLIGYSAGAECYLEEGYEIVVDTFSSGTLEIRGMTHNSNELQELVVTNSAIIKILDCDIDDSLIVEGPSVFFEDSRFRDYCNFTKNGGGNSYSQGGNIFSGPTVLNNNGTGPFGMGNANPDTFLMPLELYNTGTNRIDMAMSGSEHYFADTVLVNSTSGSGIRFCYNCSSYSFGSISKVTVGNDGFSSGTLRFRKLAQPNSDTAYFFLTSSATFDTELSTWEGNLTVTSPYLFMTNNTFNGNTSITKTGSSTNTCQGGNIFNETSSIINQGGSLTMALNYPDTFNAPVTYRMNGLGSIVAGYGTAVNYYGDDVKIYNLNPSSYAFSFQPFGSSGETKFDGNVYVNSTSIGGVLFGPGNTPTLTMTDGHTIAVGDTGFSAGPLKIRRFSQEGNTSVSITTTGSSVLDIEDSEFGGSVTFNGPGFILENDTFNSDCSFTRDTSINQIMTGSNIFYGDAQFINNGSGTILFPSTDTYHEGVTYIATSTGMIKPSNGETNYKGNIHLNDPSKVTLGLDYGTGKSIFSGYGEQTISCDSSGTIQFRDIKLDKPGYVIVRNNISIQDSLIFNSGILETSDTSIVDILSSTEVTTPNDTSYIDGWVKKTGNSAFSFPLGGDFYSHSLSIAATTSGSNEFTARYVPTEQMVSDTIDTIIDYLSSCEYWVIDANASDSFQVTLEWNAKSCGIISPLTDIVVAVFNPDSARWMSLGQSSNTGTLEHGTVKAFSKIGFSFSPIWILVGLQNNHLGLDVSYARLKKIQDAGYYHTIEGHLYFKYEEQYRDGTMDYNIYDWERNVVKSGTLNKHIGDNRYQIDCRSGMPTGFYTLEVRNDKNELEKLNFKKKAYKPWGE